MPLYTCRHSSFSRLPLQIRALDDHRDIGSKVQYSRVSKSFMSTLQKICMTYLTGTLLALQYQLVLPGRPKVALDSGLWHIVEMQVAPLLPPLITSVSISHAHESRA